MVPHTSVVPKPAQPRDAESPQEEQGEVRGDDRRTLPCAAEQHVEARGDDRVQHGQGDQERQASLS
jgi:hypothetical protein